MGYYYYERSGVLPVEVARWAGMEDDDYTMIGKLISWNDEGKDFEDLANMIEKNL